jgi:NAD(P)H-dependent FMN reductase
MSQCRLHIIIGSTRPGRRGPAVARWIHTLAVSHAGFDVRLVDLADVGLPLLDEPHPPRSGRYVGYGGVAAGARAVQALIPVVTALEMVPLAQAVHVPFVRRSFTDGRFHAASGLEGDAHRVLDDLLRLATTGPAARTTTSAAG